MSEETNPALAGIWPAKVAHYGVTLTKAKLAQATVELEVRFTDAATEQHYMKRMTWFGSFKEAAQKITLEALITMGLKKVDDLGRLAEGPNGGVLDLEKKVMVTINEESYTPDGSTTAIKQMKVQWINPADGSGPMKYITKAEATRLIVATGAANTLSELLSGNGKSAAKPAAAAATGDW